MLEITITYEKRIKEEDKQLKMTLQENKWNVI